VGDKVANAELGRGSYTAVQREGSVSVLATGNTPTPRYRVWFEPRPTDVFPPQYDLMWVRPDGPVPPVLAPYRISTSFKAPQPVRTITVFDADGPHEIPVENVEGPGIAADAPMANHYEVTSGARRVTYTTANIAGQPVLTYDRRAFTGGELKREPSPLGMLVTVTLAEIADGDRTTLTLLLPPVRLQPGSNAPVRLVGITAVAHSTIAGPPSGQAVTYSVEEFAGVADVVVS
jgi:hypothetical protein